MTDEHVSLVCMPWHMLGSPSIQLGTLQGVLDGAGVRCRSHSLHLEFQDFLTRRAARGAITIDEYGEVCSRWLYVGAGEWVFAVPPFRDGAADVDEEYLAFLRSSGMPRGLIAKLARLRELVPEFLDHCADEILASRPSIVGFTLVYTQTWPSAALAHVIKSRAPEVKILFGGASCEGPMGPALLRAFPQVDAVARGESEGSLVELVHALASGGDLHGQRGLCFRDARRIVEVSNDREARHSMDELPVPVYDEYFERLARSNLASSILPQLPFESSRGCWWGMKQHCTFCGLNGLDMRYRSKSPQRVLDELSTLASRHAVLDFTAVDNIIDLEYFRSVLPRLAETNEHWSFFYETKSNLTEAQVRLLRESGVRSIQPGIESLSTPTLRLMKKGVTALQNIRLMKWCAQYGVEVTWNLLYGFPQESPDEYARMAELLPSLSHFAAPNISPLMVDRFSPYHDRAAEHGLELAGPLPYYRLLYDLDEETLGSLAYSFAHRHLDGRDPRSYVGAVKDGIERWRRDAERNRGALSYRRGPGFLIVTDTRTTTTSVPIRYVLEEWEARAYLACDGGASVATVCGAIEREGESPPAPERVAELMRELLDARLVYEEDGRYLGLAVRRER
jgi:ribosomal peptide maturation radical SAM protein 1